MDDFAATERAMVAQVPVRAGVRTLDARFGDWFGWVCVTGLVLLVIRRFVL